MMSVRKRERESTSLTHGMARKRFGDFRPSSGRESQNCKLCDFLLPSHLAIPSSFTQRSTFLWAYTSFQRFSFSIMFRSALPRLSRSIPHNATASKRFLTTAPPHKTSRSWKNSAVRWTLAGGLVYYYNTSTVFAEEPTCTSAKAKRISTRI